MRKLWLCVATGVLCSACRVTDDRIRGIVDEQIAAKMKASSTPNLAVTPPKVSETEQSATETEPAEPPALSSLRFLKRLDALLDGATVNGPAGLDNSILQCLTGQQIQASRPLKDAALAILRQKQDRDADRRRIAATFTREFLPMHSRLDYAWKTTTYSKACVCFDKEAATAEDDPKRGRPYFNFAQGCNFSNCKSGPVSKVYSKPVFAYAHGYFPHGPDGPAYSWLSEMTSPQPPLLMRLMEQSKIEAPVRLSCQIHDVTVEKEAVAIKCKNIPGVDLGILAHGDPAGALKLNVGDTVSIPLANTERGTSGVLYKAPASWIADADLAALTVDLAAKCPTPDAILAAAPKRVQTLTRSDSDDE